MKNVTKFCILTGTFLFFLTPLNAATNFCLEEDGFIYPLISKNDCDSSNDEKLELEEYRFIRDFENKDRYQKLLTYREDLLKKKQERANKSYRKAKNFRRRKNKYSKRSNQKIWS